MKSVALHGASLGGRSNPLQIGMEQRKEDKEELDHLALAPGVILSPTSLVHPCGTSGILIRSVLYRPTHSGQLKETDKPPGIG